MVDTAGHALRQVLRAARRGSAGRRACCAVAVATVVLFAGSSAGAGPAIRARPGPAPPAPATARPPPPVAFGYRAPVSVIPIVITGFDPPADLYGPGHRGVDLALAQGLPVLAAAAGTVAFAGPVGGRPLLVITHPDGIRTEYEPVVPIVRAGQPVVSGQLLGHLRGGHASCGAVSCLHWGASRGERYIDPMGLLDRLGVVRLVG